MFYQPLCSRPGQHYKTSTACPTVMEINQRFMYEMMETSLAFVQMMQWSRCLLSHIVASYSIIFPCNSLLQVNFECLPSFPIFTCYIAMI